MFFYRQLAGFEFQHVKVMHHGFCLSLVPAGGQQTGRTGRLPTPGVIGGGCKFHQDSACRILNQVQGIDSKDSWLVVRAVRWTLVHPGAPAYIWLAQVPPETRDSRERPTFDNFRQNSHDLSCYPLRLELKYCYSPLSPPLRESAK